MLFSSLLGEVGRGLDAPLKKLPRISETTDFIYKLQITDFKFYFSNTEHSLFTNYRLHKLHEEALANRSRRGSPRRAPQIAENTQKGRTHGGLLITNIRMFETLVTRVIVVGAYLRDAPLKQQLQITPITKRCAPQKTPTDFS